MNETEKTSVAALMSVILRRKINRVVDVKWMVQNQDYAREIISLCKAQKLDDLDKYTTHFEDLMFGTNESSPYTTKTKKVGKSFSEKSASNTDDEDQNKGIAPNKYVGHLR